MNNLNSRTHLSDSVSVKARPYFFPILNHFTHILVVSNRHTFRHWYATREYAKTNVLLHVQERLGHRNINSTMVYTHLIKTEGDNYYSAIAKTTEEAQRLVENGFSFVCITPENIMLFRKPK
jgi:integrase